VHEVSLQVDQLRLALEVLLDEVELRHGTDLDLTAVAQAHEDRDLGADVAALTVVPGAGSVDVGADLGHAIGVLRGLAHLEISRRDRTLG
jgi:hypothetical protein